MKYSYVADGNVRKVGSSRLGGSLPQVLMMSFLTFGLVEASGLLVHLSVSHLVVARTSALTSK